MAERDSPKSRKWQSPLYGSHLVTNLRELYNKDELTDFTVSAEGRQFKVHRVLLAATSDYFRAMLTSPTKENQEKLVDLKGVTGSGLEQLIEFIYSSEMEVTLENLTEILNAASHLQVPAAVDLCSDYINAQISFNNAEDFLEVADMYSLTKVTSYFDNMVLQDFVEFSRSELYYSLPEEKVLKYISSDDLKIPSDRVLIECIGRWYLNNTVSDDSLCKILEQVRFCLLADFELLQIQQLWGAKLPNIVRYLTEALQYRRESKGRLPAAKKMALPRAKEKSLVLVHQGSSYRPFEITAYNHQMGKFYQLVSDICGSRDCRVAVIDNFLYICRVVDCGGGALMNSMVRFDPTQLELQTLQPCKWIRIDPALVASGNKLYILGGMSEHHVLLDGVECYDAVANRWQDVDRLPMPAQALSSLYCDGQIYLSGGISGQERLPTANLWKLNPADNSWETKTEMHFARRLHDMVSVEKQIYVVGGIGVQSYHQQSQMPMECYSIETEQWTVLASTLAGRSVGHFLYFQEAILSLGREHLQATEDDIWLYSIKEDKWAPYAKVPHRTGLASASGALLLVDYNNERISKRTIGDRDKNR